MAAALRDTSNPPAQITNPNGEIVLVKDGLLDIGKFLTLYRLNTTPDSWFFLLDHPLASGFSILQGYQLIAVPDVAPGDYSIVCEYCPTSGSIVNTTADPRAFSVRRFRQREPRVQNCPVI